MKTRLQLARGYCDGTLTAAEMLVAQQSIDAFDAMSHADCARGANSQGNEASWINNSCDRNCDSEHIDA
jgi:hypothetical protein